MPRFSIIIPTYNARSTLKLLLESLTRDGRDDFDIIVVDDASTDGTQELVNTFNTVQYVCQNKRSGPAAARNRGASIARGEWLVFTDADTCFLPDTLSAITRAVSECNADAFVETYAGRPANDGFMPRYKGLYELVTIDERLLKQGDDYISYNTWAPRPGLVNKTVFDAVDGFDETFRGADLEDMDFGYRLAATGYKIVFTPHIKIKHNYPATFCKEIRPFARRCRLWVQMDRRGGFDAAGEGSPTQAIAHLAGFTAFWSLILVPFHTTLFWVPCCMFCWYAWMNHAFIVRAFQEEGLLFAARCLITCWAHSVVMGISAGIGLLLRLWRRF